MPLINKKMIMELRRLESLIRSELELCQKEATAKFSEKLTKEAINYACLLTHDRIKKIMEGEIERFKVLNIIINYSNFPNSVEFILISINDTKIEMQQELPNPDEIIIMPRDEIKRIILSFPIEWDLNVVNKFKKSFLKKLQKEHMVPAQ
ncbi:MAG: hypothetical protein ACXQS8_00985 [Candidatus Helarchaeales archaeon]